MARFTTDISHLPRETREAIRRQLADEEAAKITLARVRQARIAQLYNQSVAPGTTKDGIGPVAMAVDPVLVSYFRNRFGAECFADSDFVKWLKKEDESFRVRETGTRIQVGYSGRPVCKRFQKRYA